MRYRRADVTGGRYFFTVNLAERDKTLLVDYVDELRDAIKQVKQRHPFEIDAMVVLPDHLHAIWTLPHNDADFSTRWGLIKAAFSRSIKLEERISSSRQAKGERGIWQRRFWEHLIRNDDDFECHVNYIHYNPVKHGYVQAPSEWQWSSIHRFIKGGVLKKDWAIADDFDGHFGE